MNTPESLREQIFGRECNFEKVDNFILEEDENYVICDICGQEDCDCQEDRKLFDKIFPKGIL